MLEGIVEYWGKEDALIQAAKWFSVPAHLMIFGYWPAIKVLQKFMENRSPYTLNKFSTFWNFNLSFLSAMGLVGIAVFYPRAFVNIVIEQKEWNWQFRIVAVCFVLSKLMEFGDTVILALKKRPILF
eukprot:Trichotokara_eunicae@DN11088_c0_g1_i1.p1